MEHSIDSDHTPENKNIAVLNAPIIANSEVDVDSSIVEHSSPVVQPPQHSIALTDLEGLLIHLSDLLKNAILLHML